ncbi:MAG: sugar phosphate isomerase/epimerase [Oscillospiraceae bacterium]|jgi:sugar phosphate isomerase/epimerase|nr:sugar phosphate isomerase/epimerase [Oscillospiraceae bacterium]
MQLGMPTLIELKTLEENAALCRELGLSFVELSMDMPEYQTDQLDAAKLRRIADKYGIYYTIHLSGFLDPCVFDKRVATAHTETALEVIAIAKQLCAPVLNMHMNRGDHFTLPDRKVALYAEYKSEYLQKLTDFRDKCTATIGGADIKVCVENTRAFQLDFVATGISLLLESPVFSLTFDIGHNAANDFRQQAVIERNIDRLYHMHLHDYAKYNGDHLPLGEGDLDLEKYLELAEKHNCRCVLEVKTIAGLRSSVEWLKVIEWERGIVNTRNS